MRTVAVAIAALSLLAAFPLVQSADECANPGSASFCRRIDAGRPSTPPGFPSVPDTPYWGTYYLWIAPGRCLSVSNDCRSVPAQPPVGVEYPGGTAGLGIFGVLFEESNGMPGLQRSFTTRPGDRMVLV